MKCYKSLCVDLKKYSSHNTLYIVYISSSAGAIFRANWNTSWSCVVKFVWVTSRYVPWFPNGVCHMFRSLVTNVHWSIGLTYEVKLAPAVYGMLQHYNLSLIPLTNSLPIPYYQQYKPHADCRPWGNRHYVIISTC